jgi:hypothetical protein
MELDVRNFCLQSSSNIQLLSLSRKAFPRIGRPFGPDGTLRHGLLVYRIARITRRPEMKATRSVRSWESVANERKWASTVGMSRPSSVKDIALRPLIDGVVSRVIEAVILPRL